MDAKGLGITGNFAAEPTITVGLVGASPDGWVRNPDGTTTIPQVKIGIGFHWEQSEPQTFAGELTVEPDGSVINRLPVEEYLRSVISSEMNANAPYEFLKAHAIVSRSWLLAMLSRESAGSHEIEDLTPEGYRRILRWYDRDAHDRFDVCSDDHCQRYQGVGRITNAAVDRAVEETRGMVLTHGGEVCDARFHKCCGGNTEVYPTAWEDKEIPYLQAISDNSPNDRCWCRTSDDELVRSFLNSYDGHSHFRWSETITQTDLCNYLKEKGGLEIGRIKEIIPYGVGKGGRTRELLLRGTEGDIVIGKELEIRRLLSETHLNSSGFLRIVPILHHDGVPGAFHIQGFGWGHGVGMCQVGASVMASRGKRCEEILHHYYTNVEISKIYE